MWPELLKAKDNIKNIGLEIDRVLKNQRALTKQEISRHHQLLLENFDCSIDNINKELEEFRKNIDNHRKYINSKSIFMKRHYSRVIVLQGNI